MRVVRFEGLKLQSHCSKALFLLLAALAATPARAVVEVAITVDDFPSTSQQSGAVPGSMTITQDLVRALNATGVPEVYAFFNGRNLTEGTEAARTAQFQSVQYWVQAGFPLGNHGYSHLDLNMVGAKDFLTDVETNEPSLRELSQGMHYKLFRYPFLHEGETREKRDEVRTGLFALGYQMAPPTIDPQDWAWNGAYIRCLAAGNETEQLRLENTYIAHSVARLQFARTQSHELFGRDVRYVALLHASALEARVLPRMLAAWQEAVLAEGEVLSFIGTTRALLDTIYSEDTGVVVSHGTTLLDQFYLNRGWSTDFAPARPDEWLGNVCR